MSFAQRVPPAAYPWSNLITLVAKKLGDAGVRYRIMGRHGLFLLSQVPAPSGDVHIDLLGRFSDIRELFKDCVFDGQTMKHGLFPGVAVRFHVPEHWKDGKRLMYTDAVVYVGTFDQLKEEAKFDRRLLDEILKAEA